MRILILFPIVCLLALLTQHSCLATSSPSFSETTNAIDDSQRDSNDESKQEKTCNLYMAPSSLVGHAGMGVYSVHDYQVGDMLLSAPDGPSIVVVDAYDSAISDEDEEDDEHFRWMETVRNHWISSFGQYWWGRGVPDHVLFEGRGDVYDYQITFGSLPNHNCLLDSVDHSYADGVYEDSLSDRYKDPGAGAYSYHRGRDFRATKEIRPGQEIFLSYGYCSRLPPRSVHFPEWTNFIPMREDYMSASRVVKTKYLQLVKEHGTAEQVPTDIEIVPPPELHPMAAMLVPKTSGHILDIMKLAPEEAGFMKISTEVISKQLARTMASTPRTKEWVLEHGVCIEHLAPAPSRIRQAGQGGILQHAVKAGEIVVPAPLLHILDRDVLKIEYRNESEPVRGAQLLLNYCFGHPESSLLLCPDTNAILINHCSTRTRDCGEEGPNSEIRWSTGWDTADTDGFLNMTIEQLAEHTDRGLSMEVVALRDLAPGEEVFIDYGPEWEAAWADHVKNWKAPQDAHIENPELAYFSCKLANLDDHAPILPSFVSGSLRDEADHPYVFTGCIYYPSEMDEHVVYLNADVDLDAMSDEELLADFSDDGSMFEGTYSRHQEGTYWPCHVLFEEETGDDSELSYTVRIEQRDYDRIEKQPWDENQLPRYLRNYPRSSIRYFPKPYESDQHLFHTFRHYIGIRDEIFPAQWKNRKEAKVMDEA